MLQYFINSWIFLSFSLAISVNNAALTKCSLFIIMPRYSRYQALYLTIPHYCSHTLLQLISPRYFPLVTWLSTDKSSQAGVNQDFLDLSQPLVTIPRVNKIFITTLIILDINIYNLFKFHCFAGMGHGIFFILILEARAVDLKDAEMIYPRLSS